LTSRGRPSFNQPSESSIREEALDMAGIFLCYRRDDTRWCAGRLHDRLCDLFGRDTVFWDVESMDWGDKFEEETRRRLGESDVVLVLIGERWLEANTSTGRPRLEDPQDWVAKELSLALDAAKEVLPVLVDDAKLPAEDSLPSRLRPLIGRESKGRLRFSDFQSDVDKLVGSLKSKASLSPMARARLGLRRMGIAGWAACLLMASATAFGLAYRLGKTPKEALGAIEQGAHQKANKNLLNTLEGIVEGSDGRPVHPATVSATVKGKSVRARTVTGGEYHLDITTLESQPDDTVDLEATAEGQKPGTFSYHYKNGLRRTLVLPR
jgi:hypothetical protein